MFNGDIMSNLFKKIVIFLTSMLYILCIFLTCFDIWIESLEDDYIVDEVSIPRIDLDGDISNMTDKKDERKIKLSYSSDDISFDKYITIKIQGSSSVRYEKKNYTIKLYNDEECSDKYRIDMGWGKEYKYVLKANWIDKTHSRNILSARITKDIYAKYDILMDVKTRGEIDGFPVEVYNNGEFLGLYTFNIPKDAWLFGLDEDNPNHLAFEAEYSNSQTRFKKKVYEYDAWTLEVGVENDENLAKLNRVIDFITKSSDEEFRENFDKYFDFDTTMTYYIMTNALLLRDNYAKNLMLITYDGEVWYPILYDLDTSFGSNPYGSSLYDNDFSCEIERNELFKRFSEVYSDEIAERYFELRQDILSEDNLKAELDEFMAGIPISSIHKEMDRWGEIPGYGVGQIRDFINKRFIYLDEVMAAKYSLKPDCEIEKDNNYCKILSR